MIDDVIDRQGLNDIWNSIVQQAKHPTQIGYPECMDKECVPLCDALNSIPGIQTSESCCGHGKDSFDIWMNADSILALYIITCAIDRRYGGPCLSDNIRGWYLEVEDTDMMSTAVHFHLHSPKHSPGVRGTTYDLDTLIEEAYTITKNIVNLIKMMREPTPQKRSIRPCFP